MPPKVALHTLDVLEYHKTHPDISYQRLGELFGISRQMVSQIIKRDKRDRMVVEYFRTHPGASPPEVKAMFGIRSSSRIRALMPKKEN